MNTRIIWRLFFSILGFSIFIQPAFSAPAPDYVSYVIYVRTGETKKDKDSGKAMAATVGRLQRGARTGWVYKYIEFDTIAQAKAFKDNGDGSSYFLVGHGIPDLSAPGPVKYNVVDKSENATPSAEVQAMGFDEVYHCGRFAPAQNIDNNLVGHSIAGKQGNDYTDTTIVEILDDGTLDDSQYLGTRSVFDYVYQFYSAMFGIHEVWTADGPSPGWWQHWVPEWTEVITTEGHQEQIWFDGHYEYGYLYTITFPYYNSSTDEWYYEYLDVYGDVWISGYYDYYWVPGHSEQITHPGYWAD